MKKITAVLSGLCLLCFLATSLLYNPHKNFPWSIAIMVDLLLLAFFGWSLVLNLRFITNRKTEFAQLGKVPTRSFTICSILLLTANIFTSNLSPIRLPFAVAITILVATLLYQFHGIFAFSYWRHAPSHFIHYLKIGLQSYFLFFLPEMFLLLCTAGLCLLLKIHFTQPFIDQLLNLNKPAQIMEFIFLGVIIAPLWEEATFRGILYPILKKHLPMGWAMLLSSFIWAASHWHWQVLVPFTFLGCALCFLYEKTGRLGNTVATHMIYNLISLLFLLFIKHYGNWQTF